MCKTCENFKLHQDGLDIVAEKLEAVYNPPDDGEDDMEDADRDPLVESPLYTKLLSFISEERRISKVESVMC